MELPSIYQYRGWEIRYNILTSDKPSSTSGPATAHPKSVVFVHGTPWSSTVFLPTIKTLLAKGAYKILVYDLPGYGQSQSYNANSDSATSAKGFEGDTSVKFQAEALTALLAHVQLDGKIGHQAPAIIAHDIAGTIVLRAHLLHGVDFDSMLLCDANTVLPWGDGIYNLIRDEAPTFLKLPPDIFEAVLRAVIRSAVHDGSVLQAAGWEDVLAGPWLGGGEQQQSFVRQIAQADDGDVKEMLDGGMYGKVRCDVKILWGEEDKWIPRGKIEELGRRVGRRAREVAFIPEAGHLCMLDQPGRFAVEVFDWLKG